MTINELNKIKNLEEIRMKSNPLNDSDRPTNLRQMMIARVGGLKMYNRTVVSGRERKGAEIDYMKKYGNLWFESIEQKSNNHSFHREHPRYAKLIERMR